MLIAFSIIGCKETEANKIANIVSDDNAILIDSIEVLKEELVLKGNKGKWYYKEQPFNGYSLKYYQNGNLEDLCHILKTRLMN